MLTSFKNSSLIKFLTAIAIVVSWSLVPSSPAGAVDEPVPLSNHDIFFSQDRHSPYSEEELWHEPFTEAELRGDSYESRIENCNTIADYDAYADCMFRPWVYGF
jgi:hypothetical protein